MTSAPRITWMHHYLPCACLGNLGCMAAFTWNDTTEDISDLAAQTLRDNGWRLDHGRWICGNHGEPSQP